MLLLAAQVEIVRAQLRQAARVVKAGLVKIGVKDKCGCGSGKKYKKCHGAAPGLAGAVAYHVLDGG